MPKKIQPFRLTSGDRKMMEVAGEDLGLFTRYYFNDWTPLPYQQKFYHAPQKDKLLIAGIRTGKTIGVAAGFLHYAFFHPGCRLANASISADQANIVFYQVTNFALRPQFEHWVESVQSHPYPIVRLVNGAEIWFRSVGYEGEYWRGWEFDWINVDEAAYIPNEVAIRTLQGRLLGYYQVGGVKLPRAGIFTMTSSPKGKTWLFERWKLGDPEYSASRPDKYLSMRARTTDNIYLSREAIDSLMEQYTDKQVDQERDGLFVDSDGSQFAYEDIIAATDTFSRPECNDLQERVDAILESSSAARRQDIDHYELPPEKEHVYINSWDLGKRPNKKGRNASVGVILDVTRKPWRVVAYRYAPGMSWGMAAEAIKEWHEKYRNFDRSQVATIIDATGKGDVLNEQITEDDRIDIEGLIYSSTTKPAIVHSLALALERKYIIFPFIRRMVDQLQAYEVPDDKIAQDIVMALGQACYSGRKRAGDFDREVSPMMPVVSHSRLPIEDIAMKRFVQRRIANRARTGRQ